MTIWEITPGGGEDFGGHVFEYEAHSDLFKCVNEGCRKYEIVVRDRKTRQIEPCQGSKRT